MLHRTPICSEWLEDAGVSQTSNPSGGRDMVGRRARADVAEGGDAVVLVHDLGRQLPGDDALEQGGHGNGSVGFRSPAL